MAQVRAAKEVTGFRPGQAHICFISEAGPMGQSSDRGHAVPTVDLGTFLICGGAGHLGLNKPEVSSPNSTHGQQRFWEDALEASTAGLKGIVSFSLGKQLSFLLWPTVSH